MDCIMSSISLAPQSADIELLEGRLFIYLRQTASTDAAHDEAHLRRVLNTARVIAEHEGAHDPLVLTAATVLHDCVNVPKNHPHRSRASQLSGEAAVVFLDSIGFPHGQLAAVRHAIEAHSYSAAIEPRTPEARALQDADRLDALGAIGIARCFAVSGVLGRALVDIDDPLAEHRPLAEYEYALDHFQTKLLGLPSTMTTETGRRIGEQRAGVMRDFMQNIAAECRPPVVEPQPEVALRGQSCFR